jgi:hypothetical protein
MNILTTDKNIVYHTKDIKFRIYGSVLTNCPSLLHLLGKQLYIRIEKNIKKNNIYPQFVPISIILKEIEEHDMMLVVTKSEDNLQYKLELLESKDGYSYTNTSESFNKWESSVFEILNYLAKLMIKTLNLSSVIVKGNRGSDDDDDDGYESNSTIPYSREGYDSDDNLIQED